MNYAPLARAVVLICGGLGLAIQARVLFTLPRDWDDIKFLWELSSPLGKAAMITSFVVPACFYSFCIATCFVRLRRIPLVTCTAVLGVISALMFWGISNRYPTIAKNALMTGLAWLFVFADQFYAKPNGLGADGTEIELVNEEPPGNEQAEPNPYKAPRENGDLPEQTQR